MQVEIPDKNLTLEFPDDMPREKIHEAIQTQIYGKPPKGKLEESYLKNLGTEVAAGAKEIKEGAKPIEVPLEGTIPEAFGGVPSGETTPMINPARMVGGAAQAVFAPITAGGQTVENRMINYDPKLGQALPVPMEAQAPEAFGGQVSGETTPSLPLATQARFVAENAVLFPAAAKIMKALKVSSGTAMEMARANLAESEAWGALDENAVKMAHMDPFQAEMAKAAQARDVQIGREFVGPEVNQAIIDREFPGTSPRAATPPTTQWDATGPSPGVALEEGRVYPQASTEAQQPVVTGYEERSYPPFPEKEKLTPVSMEDIVRKADKEKQAAIEANFPPFQELDDWLARKDPLYGQLDDWLSRETDVGKPSGKEWFSPWGPNVKMHGGGPETGPILKQFWQKSKSIPTQGDLRTMIAAQLRNGLTSKQAVERIAGDLGRHPMEVFRSLQATPAESSTIAGLEAASRAETLDSGQPLGVKALATHLTGTEPISYKGQGMVPPKSRQVQARVIDKHVPDLSKDISRIEREFRSNNIVAANHFGTTNNPINDTFSANLTYMDDAIREHDWKGNIIRELNLHDDVKASMESVSRELGPVFNEFVALHQPKVAAQKELSVLRTQLDHAMKDRSKAGLARRTDIQEKIDALLDQHQKDIAGPLDKLYAQRDRILFGNPETGAPGLAQRHANVRIKLAADGDPRAAAILSAPEKEAAEHIKAYYLQKKAQLEAASIGTIKEPYTNFVFRHALDDEANGSHTFLDSLWYRRERPTPAVLDFISRTPGSKDWFPLMSQSLDAYIPSVNHKLNFTPILDKWRPMIERWGQGGYPGASTWLNDFFKRQFSPEAMSDSSKAMNFIIGSQYLRTLFLNASVPVLHIFKALQPFWWRGPINATKAYYRYGKGIAQKIAGLEGPERQALEFYIKLPQLMQSIEQRVGAGVEYLKPSFWTKLGTGLTAVAEHIGNGISVMSTLEQAASKGITNKSLIHNEILDTIMRLDFRAMNMPNFMQEHRLLTMYQGQPWKLTENKANLLAGMLQGKSDAIGDPYLHKFVRMAAILGATAAGGATMGYDLSKHLFHLPYGLMEMVESAYQKYKEGGTAGEVAMSGLQAPVATASPPIQFLADAANPQKGVLGAVEGQVVPVLVDKLSQMAMGEHSLQYETPTQQFFGLPSAEGKEESRYMRERKRLLDEYKHPISTYYKKSPPCY